MIDQVEDLLRAGVWLGPAVLGALCYRVLATAMYNSSDQFAGAVMLATAAIIFTVVGTRYNGDKHAATGPLVFAVMFLISWSIR
jgi:hypothetical protein